MPETQELDLSRLLLPIHSDDHVHGPADASYTLIEYGDYECPACGQLFGIIPDLQAELGNTLRSGRTLSKIVCSACSHKCVNNKSRPSTLTLFIAARASRVPIQEARQSRFRAVAS